MKPIGLLRRLSNKSYYALSSVGRKRFNNRFISKANHEKELEDYKKNLLRKVYIERKGICARCSEDFKKMIKEKK